MTVEMRVKQMEISLATLAAGGLVANTALKLIAENSTDETARMVAEEALGAMNDMAEGAKSMIHELELKAAA